MATYDYFVIGGGSGGMRSARVAAQYGARVALAEGTAIGGTCVNLGCVPKKLLVYAADYAKAFVDARGYGWDIQGAPTLDWAHLIAAKNAEIARLNAGQSQSLERAGVEILRGFAKFVDPHTVEVAGKHFTAAHILLATGGQPRRLDIEGGQYAITSNEAFFLPTLPHRILIVGGGYIAVEFAHIFSGMGCVVDLMYRGDLFLRGFDGDLRRGLAEAMATQPNITLRFNAMPSSITKTNKNFGVTDTNGAHHTYDLVMAAIGRDSRLTEVGLSTIGLAVAENGKLPVDDHYRTIVPHIFAVGDISSRYALTPVAIREGQAVAEFLFAPDHPAPCVNYTALPTAVFCDPPIGTIGLSQEVAYAQNSAIDIYKTSFRPMSGALSGNAERVMMKLIVERATDKVIGLHMLGPHAGEIIQGFAVAMTAGATKEDFDRTMPIHPTVAEEFVMLRKQE